jgi:hypothetical protein
MSIADRKYRTQTYIAGGWTEDSDAINQLHKWNDSDHWGLNFNDVHSLTSSNDSTMPCNIKRSLKLRMDISKTFVLVVGPHTKTLTKGSCQFCDLKRWTFMNGGAFQCSHGRSYDTRSFIEYECELAIKANLKIVVLYNSVEVDRSKCPNLLLAIPNVTHVAMRCEIGSEVYWNYQDVRNAIG